MYDFLLTALSDVQGFFAEFRASVAILLAMALFVISLVDPRIPKFLVTLVCMALVYYGAHTYGELAGTKTEKIASEKRFELERNKLTSQYLQSAVMLRQIQTEFSTLKTDYNAVISADQEDFRSLLETLTKPPKDIGNAPKLEPASSTSCLRVTVPPDLVRSINRSRLDPSAK